MIFKLIFMILASLSLVIDFYYAGKCVEEKNYKQAGFYTGLGFLMMISLIWLG